MDYSRQAFEMLYKGNYRRMYRLAYMLVEDGEDARDAVSQVFTQMWQSQPTVSDDNLTAYLLSATRNQCFHLLRQRRQDEEMKEHFQHEAQQGYDREGRRELMEELRQLIDADLTPRDRQILALHYDEGMSYREAAEELAISPAAVNKHITLSLARLRKKLKKGNKSSRI